MKSFVERLTKNASSEVGETLRFIGGVVGVWFVIVTFLFAPFHIPSESMQPSLEVGDRVLVSKWSYGYSRHSLPLGLGYRLPDSWDARILPRTPERGDVVVFRNPEQERNLIKRVIGLPGDTILVRDGRLYINGQMVERREIETREYRSHEGQMFAVTLYEETLPNGVTHPIYEIGDGMQLDNAGPFQVPEGHLFMMGDNRDRSTDSRIPPQQGPGYVRLDEVVGRAETVMFTFNRCRREEGLHCPTGRVWRGL